MIRKFLKRLALLGVSYVVCQLGVLETTPQAYMYIDLALVGFIALVCFALIAIVGAVAEENNLASGVNAILGIVFAIMVAVELGVAWLIAKFTSLDIYTAYVVVDFIFCLIPDTKNND